MQLIDFNDTPQIAFVSGFLKGMASPFLLFGEFSALPLPTVPQIPRPSMEIESGIASDWIRVGASLQAAMNSYDETEQVSSK